VVRNGGLPRGVSRFFEGRATLAGDRSGSVKKQFVFLIWTSQVLRRGRPGLGAPGAKGQDAGRPGGSIGGGPERYLDSLKAFSD